MWRTIQQGTFLNIKGATKSQEMIKKGSEQQEWDKLLDELLLPTTPPAQTQVARPREAKSGEISKAE